MIGLALAACAGGSPAESDTDLPFDTAVEAPLTGTVTVHKRVDGVLECDYDLDLLGTEPYVGACLGCDFAYTVVPTVTRDDSIDGCALTDVEAALSFGPIADSPRWLAWTADHLEPSPSGDDLAYIDVLLAGTGAEYAPFAGTVGYWMTDHLAYDYPLGPGTAAYADGTLTFALAIDGTEPLRQFGDTCGRDHPVGAPAIAIGTDGERGTGVGIGPGDLVDVWAFDAPAAAPIAVSVDTTDATRWGPIDIDVLDPGGCVVVAHAGDSGPGAVPCTTYPIDDAGAPLWWCAGWTVTGGDAGEYRVIVDVGDNGDTVAYAITVAGATPGTLRLVEDDVAAWHIADTTFEVTGTVGVVR